MVNVVSNGQLATLRQRSGFGSTGGRMMFVDSSPLTFDDYRRTDYGISPQTVWAEQPSVRKVVDFAARAIASTPLKVYRRVSDTDRQRVTDHPLARILAQPSNGMIPFRFWHAILVDWLLWDKFGALKSTRDDVARPLELKRVSPHRLRFSDDGFDTVTNIMIDSTVKIAPEAMLYGYGYSPFGLGGLTPMETLSAILQESTEAVAYRRSIWRNSARVPVVIQRPATAPDWSPEAKSRFAAGWRSYASGGGSEGGSPILEDGMTLAKVDAFSPKDTQDIIGRQLTDAEVSSAFHIAPELVGARQGTYSNVEAFRQMLYRDALGPWFLPWEQTINTMLVPDFDTTGELYVEADVDAKLRGSFQEEAAVMSTAVGAPWLTRNEARARKNLPALEGGDDLVTPLNVITGGQASPADSGTQNLNRRNGLRRKAVDPPPADSVATPEQVAVFSDYFAEQAQAIRTALGRKDPDWWDGELWDGKLAAVMHKQALEVASQQAKSTLTELGFDPASYDQERTTKFLQAVAARNAANINAYTLTSVEAALDEPEPQAAVANLFDIATSSRSVQIAGVSVTAAQAFGAIESVRQVDEQNATKTWVTGPNPRESHSAMDGETVGINDSFSNGLDWPGAGGDADEVAGCNCTVTVQAGSAN